MTKKFYLTYMIESCYGSQVFSVDAESEEEAIEKHKNGESEFVEEEIEVQSLEKEPYEVRTDLQNNFSY